MYWQWQQYLITHANFELSVHAISIYMVGDKHFGKGEQLILASGGGQHEYIRS